MNHSTPGLPVHHQLPEFTETHVHPVSDAIQPSHPLASPSPPAPNPAQHQVFSNESTLLMRWPKYWSFSFSIIHSKEIPGLISFRMDWLDLLAVQGTLRSLLQHLLLPLKTFIQTLGFFCCPRVDRELVSTAACYRSMSSGSVFIHLCGEGTRERELVDPLESACCLSQPADRVC